MWRNLASGIYRTCMNAPVCVFFGNSAGPRLELPEVEVVEAGRVLAEDRAHLGLGLVVERVAHGLPRVRIRSFVMGIVAAPQDAVDSDLVAPLELARRG